MGQVIRVVRLPEWGENMAFELSLPRGAEIFKVSGIFAGLVNAEGNPVPTDSLFMLVPAGETEMETRRFQAADLTSGLDDLTSDAQVLSSMHYRYVGDIQSGLMLFEALDPETISSDTIGDIPVIQI